MGSFAVERFSVERLISLTPSELTNRFHEFSRLSQFDALGEDETLPWRDNTVPG